MGVSKVSLVTSLGSTWQYRSRGIHSDIFYRSSMHLRDFITASDLITNPNPHRTSHDSQIWYKRKRTGTVNHFPIGYDKKIGSKSCQEIELFTNLQKKSNGFDFFFPISGAEDAEVSDFITILGTKVTE